MPDLRRGAAGILAGMTSPFIVRLPHTDWGGICDVSSVVLGTPISLGGSYIKNRSTDLKSADLIMPVCPVITTAAHADTCTLVIDGYDQFGQRRTDRLIKTLNGQTDGCGMVAFSRIVSITPVASSDITKRVRVGFCYSNRGIVGGVDLASQVVAASTVGSCRRIPLPFKPASTSGIEVRYLGTKPEAGTAVTVTPAAADLTFTTTTVVSSAAWDPVTAGVLAGDIAYTLDGFAGIVTAADDATDTVTVAGGWFKEGVAGTPGLAGAVAGHANKAPWVKILRFSVYMYSTATSVATSNYSTTTGGMIPGHKILPLAPTSPRTGIDVAGVDINTATFGFLPSLNSETPFETQFEIFVANGYLI